MEKRRRRKKARKRRREKRRSKLNTKFSACDSDFKYRSAEK